MNNNSTKLGLIKYASNWVCSPAQHFLTIDKIVINIQSNEDIHVIIKTVTSTLYGLTQKTHNSIVFYLRQLSRSNCHKPWLRSWFFRHHGGKHKSVSNQYDYNDTDKLATLVDAIKIRFNCLEWEEGEQLDRREIEKRAAEMDEETELAFMEAVVKMSVARLERR